MFENDDFPRGPVVPYPSVGLTLVMFRYIYSILLSLNKSSSFELVIILDSIVVSIPACHAGDRGSIPRRGDILFTKFRFLVLCHSSYAIEIEEIL